MADKIQIKENSVRHKLHKDFTGNIEIAKSALAAFRDQIDYDPEYAVRWSDSAFLSAAKLNAAEQMVACLEQIGTIGEIREIFHDSIMSKARYINTKSTSPTNNYYNECLLAALSTCLDQIKWIGNLEEDFFAE